MGSVRGKHSTRALRSVRTARTGRNPICRGGGYRRRSCKEAKKVSSNSRSSLTGSRAAKELHNRLNRPDTSNPTFSTEIPSLQPECPVGYMWFKGERRGEGKKIRPKLLPTMGDRPDGRLNHRTASATSQVASGPASTYTFVPGAYLYSVAFPGVSRVPRIKIKCSLGYPSF